MASSPAPEPMKAVKLVPRDQLLLERSLHTWQLSRGALALTVAQQKTARLSEQSVRHEFERVAAGMGVNPHFSFDIDTDGNVTYIQPEGETDDEGKAQG